MSTLTSLPLSLLSRILSHLCDEEAIKSRATLRFTRDYIPNRHPAVEISLDGVRTVNSPFPSELLAPALASPILAAAAQRLMQGRLSYLTDVNTEARLSCWVDAFSDHVKAIGIIDAGQKWRDSLSRDLRKRMEEKLCCDAVDLFRTICENHVKLRVLDVVKVPFHKCGGMEDEMMTGLCTTLESCQSTLRELALPVYMKSDLCTRALATATLPHLTVLSIELQERRKLIFESWGQMKRSGWTFAAMMRAVDGHADRQKGLTSLKELRLINLVYVPCTTAKESGCSAGFFRAIKTLRVTEDYLFAPFGFGCEEADFVCLLGELEHFYWAGPPSWDMSFRFYKQLKEIHLCHHISRTGERVTYHRGSFHLHDIRNSLHESQGKFRTLVVSGVYSRHLREIRKSCSNLQHLSLHVTAENIDAVGKLLQKCSRLTKLEVFFRDEKKMDDKCFLKMGRLIPGPSKLRELEFRMGLIYGRRGEPIDVLVNCLVGIIKRIGDSSEKLLFRLHAKHQTATQSFDALCRIMDCCADHSRVLTHLDVDISQEGWYRRYPPPEEKFLRRIYEEELSVLAEAANRLRLSKEKLVESQPCLNKIYLGAWHRFLI